MSTRPYVGTYVRKHQVLKTGHYARIDTAIPRAMTVLLLQGEPGDVFELASKDFGYQIAVVKVHAGGKITLITDLKG